MKTDPRLLQNGHPAKIVGECLEVACKLTDAAGGVIVMVGDEGIPWNIQVLASNRMSAESVQEIATLIYNKLKEEGIIELIKERHKDDTNPAHLITNDPSEDDYASEFPKPQWDA